MIYSFASNISDVHGSHPYIALRLVPEGYACLRRHLENPTKMIHQKEENLMVEWLRWDSKALHSQVSSPACPYKKGKGKANRTEITTCVFPPGWSSSFGKQSPHPGTGLSHTSLCNI